MILAYLSCYVSEGKDGKSKTPAPSVVLENLRLTLTDYRKRLDNTSDEVNTVSYTSTMVSQVMTLNSFNLFTITVTPQSILWKYIFIVI